MFLLFFTIDLFIVQEQKIHALILPQNDLRKLQRQVELSLVSSESNEDHMKTLMERNMYVSFENIVLYCDINDDNEIFIQSGGDSSHQQNDDDIKALQLQNEMYADDEEFRDYDDDSLGKRSGAHWIFYQPGQQRQLRNDNEADVTPSSIERI